MEVQPPGEEPKPVLDYGKPQKPLVPTHRKVLAWIMICGGIPFLVLAMIQSNPSARMNIMLPGLMLIVWGTAIRYQHVRF